MADEKCKYMRWRQKTQKYECNLTGGICIVGVGAGHNAARDYCPGPVYGITLPKEVSEIILTYHYEKQREELKERHRNEISSLVKKFRDLGLKVSDTDEGSKDGR